MKCDVVARRIARRALERWRKNIGATPPMTTLYNADEQWRECAFALSGLATDRAVIREVLKAFVNDAIKREPYQVLAARYCVPGTTQEVGDGHIRVSWERGAHTTTFRLSWLGRCRRKLSA